MTDVLNQQQRRFNMSRIRAKNTKPEMLIRRSLHALGYRYQLHRRDLKGSPDLVFPMYKGILFVHGCFWHGHNCHLFKLPATRTEFWSTKIRNNISRDKAACEALRREGWRVLTIWECAVRGTDKLPVETLVKKADGFLKGSCPRKEIMGTNQSGLLPKLLTVT